MMKHRIVIAEDDTDLAGALHEMLQDDRIEIEVATNGIEAVARIRDWKPHLVLLDVSLPGMDGFEVFRIIRKDPDCRGTHVVFMSGVAQAGAFGLARELGADGWVRKPFKHEVLLSKVAAVLGLPHDGTPAHGLPAA